MSSGDKKFMEKAAAGGMAEVELGQLAQQKASSDQVKQFGARMAQDHSKANEELKQLATSKGVQVPASLDKDAQKDKAKLEKLSGADFDREYMKMMVDDHKDDVSAFEKTAKSGKDPELKSFAAKTLPTLQEHKQLAQTTYAAVKQTKKSASSETMPATKPATKPSN
jgi:putative membrane protein